MLKPIVHIVLTIYLYVGLIHPKSANILFGVIFNVIKRLSNGRIELHLKLLSLVWMDEAAPYQKVCFLKNQNGVAYGPHYFGEEQLSESVHLPNVNFYLFENARISVNSSSVIINDEQAVIERAVGPDQNAYSFSSGHIIVHRKDKALVRLGNTKDIKEGLFLGGNGSSNYYHWIIEILARLEYRLMLPTHYQDLPLLISEDVMNIPSFKYTLNLFAKDCKTIVLEKEKSYRVDRLIYITSPNNLPFNLRGNKVIKRSHTTINPSSIEYIRKHVLDTVLDETGLSNHSKRIFLCRKKGLRDYNQDEVFKTLSSFGFTKVYMEDFTFSEQVKIIHYADYIVGPTGAAWTNLIFCKEGAKALCWMPEEAIGFSAYSTLASIIGVDLVYLTYRAGVVSTADLYFRDYYINPDKIEQALIQCEA